MDDTTQGTEAQAPDDTPEYTITETSTERPEGEGADEDEGQELARYRVLLGQSLRVFRKAVENCRKAEETVGNDTRETDAKLQQTDHLIGLLDDQRALDLGITGTPIGAAIAEGVARANGTEPDAGGDDDADDKWFPGRRRNYRAAPAERPKAKGKGKRSGHSSKKRGAR